MEQATSPPALAMLSQAGVLPNPPADLLLLDNACGAGCVTANLFKELGKEKVESAGIKIVCTDIQPNMVSAVSERIKINGWETIVEAKVVDAQKNSLPDDHFSHVLMNFGPQLIPDPLAALKETYRILRPSGVAGFTCWTNPGWLPSILQVFPSFKLPPTLTGSWINPQFLQSTFTDVGFSNVLVKPVVFKTQPGGGVGGEEGGIEMFLAMMKVLLPLLREEENGRKYDEFMRKEYGAESREVEMTWEALVITAHK